MHWSDDRRLTFDGEIAALPERISFLTETFRIVRSGSGLQELCGEATMAQTLGLLQVHARSGVVAAGEPSECAAQAGIGRTFGGLQQAQIHPATATFGRAIDASAAVGTTFHQVSR